jgi:ribosome-associated toxin RatA of RatAB toxin-antitoxin module
MSSKPLSMVLQFLVLAVSSGVTSAWQLDATELSRLMAGEIIVSADVDPGGASGRAKAAVLIKSPPARVFALMTDCARALSFVPNLTRCEVLRTGPDRSYEIIAHEINYSWFLPLTRYVFRADYVIPSAIQFSEVSGDLKVNRGSWRLQELSNGGATVVSYEVRLQPRIYVPEWLVRRSLRKDLPELLSALRDAAATDSNR